MGKPPTPTVAILYHGDREARKSASPENNRLATVFQALGKAGMKTEPAVYNDAFHDEVHEQLLQVNGVLVWRNPVQDGADRSVLDSMLREVGKAGVFVSAHPDVILKMGTKEVLHTTRSMEWGCDTRLYRDMDALKAELPGRLTSGPRVIKRIRGNGGDGVWRVELCEPGTAAGSQTPVRVRHAKRGSVEELMPLGMFYSLCEQYFSGKGRMIDQEYQSRLPEGMIRCYLTQDAVVGFGHQEVNALFPAPEGANPKQAPQPGERLYYPLGKTRFQHLRERVEGGWVAEMQRILGIATEDLPMLWDCDFMFGPRDEAGNDTYVLCEINASSVAPYPETAPAFIAQAVLARLEKDY